MRHHVGGKGEHTALKWVMPRELTQYPMPAADLPLIPMLRDLL